MTISIGVYMIFMNLPKSLHLNNCVTLSKDVMCVWPCIGLCLCELGNILHNTSNLHIIAYLIRQALACACANMEIYCIILQI